MLRLIVIVLSVGLADSLDPTTVGPGLYLALGAHPARRVFRFAAGVFLVMAAGGLVVVLGPGQLLLSLVPHPSHRLEHWLEVGVGIALMLGASVVWGLRRRLSQRELFRATPSRQRSSLWLGVGVMTVNLPVALPYFAALAAIIASGRPLVTQAGCVMLYSLCFVAPLLGIVAVLELLPHQADARLDRVRELIERHWAQVLAAVLMVAGGLVTALGVVGLAASRG
ncbi:MAG TPA: GAP family protein [Solirubrobacteraceae bacterium]|nr:GAP family protein [Solirubrobacteraceae bacterium]